MENEVVNAVFQGWIGILPFLGVILALCFAFRLIHDRISPQNDKEETGLGKLAVGLSRGGAYLGFILATCGSLIMSGESYWTDLRMFAIDGVIALGVFAAACYVFDWVILRKVNNAEQICLNNVPVGFVEFCAYVSLGLIMCGSFAGGGASFGRGIASAILFSGLGLGTLVVIYWVYSIFWRKLDKQIEQGNLAAAIDVGSLMLGMSFALMLSIIGDFTGWANDIMFYFIAAASSVLSVAVARVFASVVVAVGPRVLATAVVVGQAAKSDTVLSPDELSEQIKEHVKANRHGNVARSAIIGSLTVGFGIVAGLRTFF